MVRGGKQGREGTGSQWEKLAEYQSMDGEGGYIEDFCSVWAEIQPRTNVTRITIIELVPFT